MPRAAIYARYSSHSQRSESIEIQLEATRKYCAEHGLDVVHEYAVCACGESRMGARKWSK